jgi:uncharacterized protein (DUF697 family)
MAKINELGQLWKIAGEIDVSAIQQEAMQTPRLAVIGPRDKAGIVQGALQRGPHAVNQPITTSPTFGWPLSYSDVGVLANYDLRLVLLEDAAQVNRDDLIAVGGQPAPLLMVLDAAPGTAVTVAAAGVPGQASSAQPQRILVCPLQDEQAVQKVLLPALVEQARGRELAWARAYPGLRPLVCHKLTLDTSLTNAGYAFGTGVAEMVPVLALPFAIADIIILTKNQLIMAYKIAMAMGETGSLRELLPKLASVVGAGFMWRQIARELVGFIPLGIVLKVGIAYAGTYVTGQAIYRWYADGEKIKPSELKALFQEAFERGQEVAAQMMARVRKEKQPPALLAGPGTAADALGSQAVAATASKKRKVQVSLPKRKKA